MPVISRFYGIEIRMYFDDHNPPHFHVIYGKQEAMISILELKMMEGNLSKRATMLTIEWALQHREALMENWELMKGGFAPKRISPLR